MIYNTPAPNPQLKLRPGYIRSGHSLPRVSCWIRSPFVVVVVPFDSFGCPKGGVHAPRVRVRALGRSGPGRLASLGEPPRGWDLPGPREGASTAEAGALPAFVWPRVTPAGGVGARCFGPRVPVEAVLGAPHSPGRGGARPQLWGPQEAGGPLRPLRVYVSPRSGAAFPLCLRPARNLQRWGLG